MRRGKTTIAGRELAARDGGGGARLCRRVDLRRAHGAGGGRRWADRQHKQRKVRLESEAAVRRRKARQKGHSLSPRQHDEKEGRCWSFPRWLATAAAVHGSAGRVDLQHARGVGGSTKRRRCGSKIEEEGRSARRRALRTLEIPPTRLRGRRPNSTIIPAAPRRQLARDRAAERRRTAEAGRVDRKRVHGNAAGHHKRQDATYNSLQSRPGPQYHRRQQTAKQPQQNKNTSTPTRGWLPSSSHASVA